MGRAKTKPRALTPGWVIYARTSDEDAQAPERSLGSQRRLCMERLIADSGISLLEEYSDVYSGRATDRKNYQRLLTDARNGSFSHVAIAFVDRFGRNDVEGIRAFDELHKLGVIVRIATYPSLDPATPDGRMIVTMLFGVARFESDRIGQRCREGMHSKLLAGDWAWKAPDGYVNREQKLSEVTPAERGKYARYKRWIELDPEQGKVWRHAWDLLLTGDMSISQICEALHARGYRLRSGLPFVTITPKGRRRHPLNIVSRIFHNWFYAGWVVVDTDWATIEPKTLRGNWTPIVSTEELEAGMAILAGRTQLRNHKKKHFYLLKGLVYLQDDNNQLTRLRCSRPNANRKRGGVSYYCIASSNFNFLCHQIDADYVPQIRQQYVAELEKYVGKHKTDERTTLEKALKELADEELRCARLHAKGQLSDETWETLWRERQDQRNVIQAALDSMGRNCEAQIGSLDDAIQLIAKAGILFEKVTPAGKQELLRHMVKRVIINREGKVLRLELRTPFSYLHRLATDAENTPQQAENGSSARKAKTSRSTSAGSPNVPLGAPGGSRTPDLSLRRRPLYPLSYEGV